MVRMSFIGFIGLLNFGCGVPHLSPFAPTPPSPENPEPDIEVWLGSKQKTATQSVSYSFFFFAIAEFHRPQSCQIVQHSAVLFGCFMPQSLTNRD